MNANDPIGARTRPLTPLDVPSAVPTAPPQRRSRLGRLYSYSKDTAFTAQENFTTEALAIAILDFAEPMLRSLRRLLGLIRSR